MKLLSKVASWIALLLFAVLVSAAVDTLPDYPAVIKVGGAAKSLSHASHPQRADELRAALAAELPCCTCYVFMREWEIMPPYVAPAGGEPPVCYASGDSSPPFQSL